jgi:hypothetical protein
MEAAFQIPLNTLSDIQASKTPLGGKLEGGQAFHQNNHSNDLEAGKLLLQPRICPSA